LLLQVAVSDSDIDFKWSISQQLPQGAAAAAPPAAPPPAAAAPDARRHYSILLAKMAGLPATITDSALQIAQRLDAQQQQRQQQQEVDGAMQRLRQVYSLVHKLGCVARGAASQGQLEVDAAGQPVGDSYAGGQEGGGGKEEFGKCMQMVQQLKQEAEKLLLDAARQPVL
jgi:hypothetical protein